MFLGTVQDGDEVLVQALSGMSVSYPFTHKRPLNHGELHTCANKSAQKT